MAHGRIISGRATVVTSGTAVALSATRKIVRDLQVQKAWMSTALMMAGGSAVHANTQQGTILPAYNSTPGVVSFRGPLDLRRVFVDANDGNQTAVWIATEAE